MLAIKTLVVLTLGTMATSSAIPIWELLTRQEKMGRLMYVFIHLVDQYCKNSDIPDCSKVLMLYGMSNLVNEEEDALDYLDPYQRNSRGIIWAKVMKGDFKLPSYKNLYSNDVAAPVEDYDLVNEVQDGPSYPSPSLNFHKTVNDPHPYAVRVPAPAKITATHAAHSSHPYAVRVAPPTSPPAVNNEPLSPMGIKASADFEPMMTESRISTSLVHRLLPSSSPRRLVRARREVFPEHQMKELLSHVLRK
ncbi:rhythmically expressed gene 5 protein-like [Homarus americanus]|nr:rhythmically expressed gene 5 protein-like [Homarus americanus]